MVSPAARPSFLGATSLLVGRDRELGILREHLTAALAGQGNLVLLSGEAGVGKTALAEALGREASQQDALILVGRCFDLAETPPYGPWVELFRYYRPTETLPPLPDAFTRRGAVGEATSQTMLFQQMEDFFTTVAAQRPLLVLLDDLHWSDPASLDLLRFLARSLAALPILVVVTYRADELARRHPLHTLIPLLEREAGATRLDVRRLGREAVQTLVAAQYHLSDADASRLITYLTARAEGNALFTLQFLRALEESAALEENENGWIVGDLNSVGVPLSLQQVIDGRAMRLGEEIQRPLQVAAVIGQEVAVELWATVTAMDEETALTVVERAAAARLLEATPDGERVRFVHALIREALYEAIPPLRRRILHRQVAEAVTHLAHPDADVVAYHFQRAGDARAAGWLVKAGEHAQRVYARSTAADRYQAALALMEQHGAGANERGWLLYRLANAKAMSDTPTAIADLQEATRLAAMDHDCVLTANAVGFQGNLRVMYGHVRQGLTGMETAVEMFGSLSPEDRARLVALDVFGTYSEDLMRGALLADLGNAGYYAQVLSLGAKHHADIPTSPKRDQRATPIATVEKGFGLAYAGLGMPVEAREAFTREREARLTRDEYWLAGASARNELRYVVLPYQTDDVEARRQLADLAEESFIRALGPQTRNRLQQGRLPLLVLDGDWAQARAVAAAIIALGWHRAEQNHARSELGLLARLQGEPTLAQRMVDAELPAGRATAPGDAPCFLDALLAQRLAAALALDAGDLTTAHAWLAMHDRWLAWSGSVRGRSEGEALWAECFRAKGDGERAWRHATSALAHATTPRQPLAALAAHRLLGALATEAGQILDAAEHLAAARTIAEVCVAPYEKALTLLALATLHGATGDRAGALALLDEVRAICTPLDAKPTLAQASALAARLEARDAPTKYPAGLSAREVEVLRLMANGETNRDIAAALFLSERTINKHVTHILTKTDTDNRTAAAAFAHRHGLI